MVKKDDLGNLSLMENKDRPPLGNGDWHGRWRAHRTHRRSTGRGGGSGAGRDLRAERRCRDVRAGLGLRRFSNLGDASWHDRHHRRSRREEHASRRQHRRTRRRSRVPAGGVRHRTFIGGGSPPRRSPLALHEPDSTGKRGRHERARSASAVEPGRQNVRHPIRLRRHPSDRGAPRGFRRASRRSRGGAGSPRRSGSSATCCCSAC